MKNPKVTLSIRIDPEVAIVLKQEAERRDARSVNEFVSTVLTDFVTTTRIERAEKLRF